MKMYDKKKSEVFGAAKPVDTASRELEIEERLAQSRKEEQLRNELKQQEVDVNEKLAEVQLEKPDKENANAAISWRCRDEPVNTDRPDLRKQSPDGRGFTRRNNEDRRKDNRDYNRDSKNHERNERYKDKFNQNRDGKQKDDKSKRDSKTERPMPKLQLSLPVPALQTSNKYSGLDDEASD